MHSNHSSKCHRCGNIIPKSIIAFICSLCILGQAAYSDGFIKVAYGDQPINGPSSKMIEHIYTTTNGTVVVSLADFVTDFINVQKVEHPKPNMWVERSASE